MRLVFFIYFGSGNYNIKSKQAAFLENKTHYRNFFILLVTCLLAYWPLTFGVFSVKNDAIHYFLPYRYNISEALRNGAFPFWSPYIYQGYPIYGDMQSGAWNPIVWIFSIFGRYDLTLFHWENLVYIFLSGVGMYKLVFYQSRHAHTALFAGFSYMLCGFLLSGQLINWLAAAGFIPFVILYYLKATSGSEYYNGIKTGLALWMLFVAGYPSFFILMVYGLAGILIFRLLGKKQHHNMRWGRFVVQHAIILVVFAGLAMPAIISYADLLPYYQRGNGIAYSDALHNSFEWQHLLSMLFPSAIHASDLVTTTDVTCRNMYAGILLLPVIFAFPPEKNIKNGFLVVLTILAFLFSLGDATPFRKLLFDFIPLMDTFRHPSQTRLFVMIGLLLMATPGIKILLNKPSPVATSRMFHVTTVFAGCILMITIIAGTQSRILQSAAGISANSSGIKQFIESTELHDVVLLNGIIQLLTLGLILIWLKRKSRKPGRFVAITAVNLVVLAQFILPITFVSQTDPGEINGIIKEYSQEAEGPGFQQSLVENSRDMDTYYDKMGSILFYSKRPGISKVTNTPSYLTQMDTFLLDEKLYRYVGAQLPVYFAGHVVSDSDSIPGSDTACSYVLLKEKIPVPGPCGHKSEITIPGGFRYNRFTVSVENSSPGILVISQNFHHGWKVWEGKNEIRLLKVNHAFLGVSLRPGKHKLKFTFQPTNRVFMVLGPVTTMLIIVFSAIERSIHRKKTI